MTTATALRCEKLVESVGLLKACNCEPAPGTEAEELKKENSRSSR